MSIKDLLDEKKHPFEPLFDKIFEMINDLKNRCSQMDDRTVEIESEGVDLRSRISALEEGEDQIRRTTADALEDHDLRLDALGAGVCGSRDPVSPRVCDRPPHGDDVPHRDMSHDGIPDRDPGEEPIDYAMRLHRLCVDLKEENDWLRTDEATALAAQASDLADDLTTIQGECDEAWCKLIEVQKERDEAIQARRIAEIRTRQCSEEDACRFVRERDDARAELTGLHSAIDELSVSTAAYVELLVFAQGEAKPTIVSPEKVHGILQAVQARAKEMGDFGRCAVEAHYAHEGLRARVNDAERALDEARADLRECCQDLAEAGLRVGALEKRLENMGVCGQRFGDGKVCTLPPHGEDTGHMDSRRIAEISKKRSTIALKEARKEREDARQELAEMGQVVKRALTRIDLGESPAVVSKMLYQVLWGSPEPETKREGEMVDFVIVDGVRKAPRGSWQRHLRDYGDWQVRFWVCAGDCPCVNHPNDLVCPKCGSVRPEIPMGFEVLVGEEARGLEHRACGEDCPECFPDAPMKEDRPEEPAPRPPGPPRLPKNTPYG